MTLGNHVYLGAGRYLYRSVGLDATSWGSLTQVADLGAGRVITSLAWYGGKIAIATGNGLDIRLFDPTTLAGVDSCRWSERILDGWIREPIDRG